MQSSLVINALQNFSMSAPKTAIDTTPNVLEILRSKHERDISRLTEVIKAKEFIDWLQQHEGLNTIDPNQVESIKNSGLTKDQLRTLFIAAVMTFLVHVESRAASSVGQGFYTIGPCGEELMGALAMSLRTTDSLALHYRHVATQITRQLLTGRSIEDILLDRARGHTVSTADPVTGGVHCAIGGGEYDFLVTSTLASQACPAVGRALATGLSNYIATDPKASGLTPHFPKDAVSVVSVGDGSANNAHFLSAINLAEYSAHRKFKCPVVFIVTDNDISISLRGHGWMGRKWIKKLGMPVFEASGNDVLAIYKASNDAIAYSRTKSAPTFVYIHSIKRRFGHAATDRQAAYMNAEEISALADANPIEKLATLLSEAGVLSFQEMLAITQDLWNKTKMAFNKAAAEPKITSRKSMNERVTIPIAPLNSTMKYPEPQAASDTQGTYSLPNSISETYALHDRSKYLNPQTRNYLSILNERVKNDNQQESLPSGKDVMRKHMTRVYDELLTQYPQAVYIGEDVEHGGYYLVTDGLVHKYPGRVRDFPPDETSLLGVGVGMAQSGLLPIVEIPYAKYLDCGADMFFELALSSWLSETRQPNGMIIRLQGFGKGIFGGNFHTHNTLHLPPGLDVVCYSNGADYARGMRYAALQAAHGRIVMSVDFTHLLNLRHVYTDDDGWRKPYTASNEVIDFDQIITYPPMAEQYEKKIAYVTYGEGVITSLQARQASIKRCDQVDITIIDCPLLSRTPTGLHELFQNKQFDGVLFIDPCKVGHTPLSQHCSDLNNESILPRAWGIVGAQPTYNPLGSTLTFVSVDDIELATSKILGRL